MTLSLHLSYKVTHIKVYYCWFLLSSIYIYIYIHECVVSWWSIDLQIDLFFYLIFLFPFCCLKFVFKCKHSVRYVLIFLVFFLAIRKFWWFIPFFSLFSLDLEAVEYIVLEAGMLALKFSRILVGFYFEWCLAIAGFCKIQLHI